VSTGVTMGPLLTLDPANELAYWNHRGGSLLSIVSRRACNLFRRAVIGRLTVATQTWHTPLSRRTA
jgi:hypothetical protein